MVVVEGIRKWLLKWLDILIEIERALQPVQCLWRLAVLEHVECAIYPGHGI